MIILLTNDDGLGAPGLEALEKALAADHQVWTVAPDREMSGRSHGITLNEGLKIVRHPDRRFAVRGTPVDCVNLALQALMVSPPDLCISGINRGPNLGTDIVYSGTCAAAREAAFREIPAIAASYASFRGPWDYEAAAEYIAGNLDILLDLWRPDRFININWPEQAVRPRVVEITRPAYRRFRDKMVCFNSPRGGEYWFLQTASIESSEEEGTDARAVRDGRISVAPVSLEPVLAPIGAIHDTMVQRGT